jgi:benzoyl-CoA reductase/2-hydroxyglutaryl-CoA dehydratase subunit BcrC/BadD/HgdB
MAKQTSLETNGPALASIDPTILYNIANDIIDQATAKKQYYITKTQIATIKKHFGIDTPKPRSVADIKAILESNKPMDEILAEYSLDKNTYMGLTKTYKNVFAHKPRNPYQTTEYKLGNIDPSTIKSSTRNSSKSTQAYSKLTDDQWDQLDRISYKFEQADYARLKQQEAIAEEHSAKLESARNSLLLENLPELTTRVENLSSRKTTYMIYDGKWIKI